MAARPRWNPMAARDSGKLLTLTPILAHMASMMSTGARQRRENTMLTMDGVWESGCLNT